MNIYKGIEYIKDFFSGKKVSNTPNPFKEEDIDLLVEMRIDARYLKAKNGIRYFYYRINDDYNIDVAKFLMQRNGLNARTHKSSYYTWKPTILRIPKREIDKSKEKKEFIEKISYTSKTMGKDIEERIKSIRNQMHQK